MFARTVVTNLCVEYRSAWCVSTSGVSVLCVSTSGVSVLCVSTSGVSVLCVSTSGVSVLCHAVRVRPTSSPSMTRLVKQEGLGR